MVIVRQLLVQVSHLEFEENLSNCIGADIESDRHESTHRLLFRKEVMAGWVLIFGAGFRTCLVHKYVQNGSSFPFSVR
jgi:hypothetical protein